MRQLAAAVFVLLALATPAVASPGPSFGDEVSATMNRSRVEGVLIVVVKMKNVMSRNPRSTIGVISTRVESFFAFFTPGPFLCPLSPLSSILAIVLRICDYQILFTFFLWLPEQLFLYIIPSLQEHLPLL